MDKLAGIYKIENMKNGKIYIGETEDVPRRWVEHLTNLILNQHHSYKLQNDFNEYSISDFKFEVIETILLTDENRELTSTAKLKMALLCREHAYIKKYDSINTGYNIQETLVTILNKEKSCFGSGESDDKSYNVIKGFIKQNKELLSLDHELILDDIILSGMKKRRKKDNIIEDQKKSISENNDIDAEPIENYKITKNNTNNIGGIKLHQVYNKFIDLKLFNITLPAFKTLLTDNNIIFLHKHSYRPTKDALDNNIVIRGALSTNGKGYQFNHILVTPSGEQYIKDIICNQSSVS